MLNINDVLSRFDGVRGGGTKYQMRCPCHDDKNASLSLSVTQDRYLLHCHAGCDTKSILDRAGLSFSDIDDGITESRAQVKKRPAWQLYLEKITPGFTVGAAYDYKDENGGYLYSCIRMTGEGGAKTFKQGVIRGDKIELGIGNIEKTLYNLPAVLSSLREYKNRRPVFIVEGEKDVETMKSLGLTNTVTAGGATGWREAYAKYFIGADVVILPDNDASGRELAKTIIKSIKPYASRITVCTVSSREKGDVTDYISDGHTRADLLSLIERAQENIKGFLELKNACGFAQYPDWIDASVKVDRSGSVSISTKINPDNLSRAVAKSLNYVKVRNDLSDDDTLYVYKNGVYKPCNENAAKEYIKSFIPQGMAKNHTLKEVYSLLMCSDSRVISYGDLNSDERYINLKNGLYDLRQDKLLAHTPEVLSTMQFNCRFDEGAEAPVFLKYIDDLCTDSNGEVDEQERDLIQEWTGLILSNIPICKVKQCLVLHSIGGNTGKTQFIDIMTHIIGKDYVCSLDLQTLGGRDDRFSTGFLYGKRMNINGDQRADEIQNTSVFKMLTGGDYVKAEPKGRQAFSFRYTGGLMFACNDLPMFSTDKGGYMYDRFCIIPCENVIPQAKRDKSLPDKLRLEADGIFMWALSGLKRLISNGYRFTKCERSQEVMNEYIDKLDSVSQFLRQYCRVTDDDGDKIKKTELEDKYTAYMLNSGRTPVGRSKLKERFIKCGLVFKDKYCGYPCYSHIAPKDNYLLELEEIDTLYLPEKYDVI